MKTKFLTVTLLCVILCAIQSTAQSIPTYPIPSYNVEFSGYADFREAYHEQNAPSGLEKREVNVEIKSSGASTPCSVRVWVYRLDQSITLGPYTAYCEQLLTVEIDENEWGVLIQSTTDVEADVYISN